MRKVRVDLGAQSYDIVIGHDLAAEIEQFIRQADFSKKALLITDSNVGPLYGKKVLSILKKAGLTVELVEIDRKSVV